MGGRGNLPDVLLALLASASCGTLAASRLSAGAGALSWRLVQDSRGEDMGCLLVVVPHGGGADGDRLQRLLPLFRADDGREGLDVKSFNVAGCDWAKGENTSEFAIYIETKEIDILNNDYTKQITQPW